VSLSNALREALVSSIYSTRQGEPAKVVDALDDLAGAIRGLSTVSS
jgi:hypothetical protein